MTRRRPTIERSILRTGSRNASAVSQYLRTTIRVTDGFICEGAVFGETVHEPAEVFVLNHLVGLPNRCFVRQSSKDSKLIATGPCNGRRQKQEHKRRNRRGGDNQQVDDDCPDHRRNKQ
jgi:hypothetical protein